jgi:CMP-N,N'-diacetyllegionaminic acid synthase
MSTRTPAIVIILARAGSKGVPGKNVAMLAGEPCIAWTIRHAQHAARAGLIAVSSDDARALAAAKALGCLCVPRPAELASDTARIDDAARHALTVLRESQPARCPPDAPVVILYANVPVRPAGLIDRALDLLDTTGCDSVQSYQHVGKFHPWWMAKVDPATGAVTPWEGDVLNHGIFRRQDLPPACVPDGAIIVCSQAALMLRVPGVAPGPHAFFGKDRRGVINPEGSVVDIDEPMDLLLAEARLRTSGGGSTLS